MQIGVEIFSNSADSLDNYSQLSQGEESGSGRQRQFGGSGSLGVLVENTAHLTVDWYSRRYSSWKRILLLTILYIS